jgi:hypothetical protein
MVGLIILSTLVLGGIVYLGLAIKNAPVIEDNQE